VKLLSVTPLGIPDVKVLRFARFADHRGYFTEHFRHSDFLNHPELACFQPRKGAFPAGLVGEKGVEFVQANESYSRRGTVRGLHFQWEPYVGKLVRTVMGRMVDLVLDIRIGSPTFGRILAYDIPASPERDHAEWIWVPPGFAHGNFFPEETVIEYLCTGAWNPAAESGISPLAPDLDWSLCDPGLRELFLTMTRSDGLLISDKDRNGHTLASWTAMGSGSRSASGVAEAREPRAAHFTYGRL